MKCRLSQGRIQPVKLWGAILVLSGSQVSQKLRYCKGDEVYFTTIDVARGGKRGHASQIFRKYSHFVLSEAFVQTK